MAAALSAQPETANLVESSAQAATSLEPGVLRPAVQPLDAEAVPAAVLPAEPEAATPVDQPVENTLLVPARPGSILGSAVDKPSDRYRRIVDFIRQFSGGDCFIALPAMSLDGAVSGGKKATSMKVCGWSGQGPAGDGTHSLGETSRLRVKLRSHSGGLKITMEMSAVIRPPQTTQRVVISLNGVRAHEVTLTGKPPRIVSFDMAPALANSEVLDVTLDYLDGIPPDRFASNTYKRAIKLLSFRIDTIGAGKATRA